MPAPTTTTSVPPCPAPVGVGEAVVFFVEDEDYIADLMTVIFERAGWRTLRARDGAQALRLATENPAAISVAMVDLCLPDISGDELCRQLRAMRPGLPVLLTSGRDMEIFLAEFERGGPTATIAKPYRPADLLRQVRAMLPAAA